MIFGTLKVLSMKLKNYCNAGNPSSTPTLGRSPDPWRKAWQPTPVFLPGEFHGQRSLDGYSPWGHKVLDTTEKLTHTDKLSVLMHWKIG